jgi:hypothetical protein
VRVTHGNRVHTAKNQRTSSYWRQSSSNVSLPILEVSICRIDVHLATTTMNTMPCLGDIHREQRSGRCDLLFCQVQRIFVESTFKFEWTRRSRRLVDRIDRDVRLFVFRRDLIDVSNIDTSMAPMARHDTVAELDQGSRDLPTESCRNDEKDVESYLGTRQHDVSERSPRSTFVLTEKFV